MDIKINWAKKENYGSSRNLNEIKFLVIHYTAVDGDNAISEGNYFAKNVLKTSAHYFVDSKNVVQSVPDTYVAWHCGGKKLNGAGGSFYGVCKNQNSIGIEICDDVKDGVIHPSEKTIDNAVELTKELMKKYNIPAENVIRHFDVTSKQCPLYFVDDYKWNRDFKSKLTESEYFTGVGFKDGKLYEIDRGKLKNEINV